MLVNLEQSLSYIWGKQIPINSMNRVSAIRKLIETPQAPEKDINDILGRTKQAWDGVKTFLNKIRLTLWVLFWNKHRVSLNGACDKLNKIIHKVVNVAEKALPKVEEKKTEDRVLPIDKPAEDEKTFVYEVTDEDSSEEVEEEIGVKEVQEDNNTRVEREMAEIEKKIESFDKEHENHNWFKTELDKYNTVIRVNKENPPLLEEYKQKSLALFEIEDKLPKPKVKAKLLHRVIHVKKAETPNETKLQDEAKAKGQATTLKGEILELKTKIDENFNAVAGMHDIKNLPMETLEAKSKELQDLIDQRQKLVDELAAKKKEYSWK